MKRLLIAILIVLPASSFAQMNTDLYLFKVVGGNSDFRLDYVRNLTERPGYDNQPCFSADGKKVYYSARYKLTHDVYEYDLTTGKNKNVSRSPYTSEFSPMPTPDGSSITAVLIEEDSVTQRMWRIAKSNARAKVMHKKIDSIGYYWPLGDEKYAAFILGTNEFNHSLRILNMNDGSETYVTDSVGRCIRTLPWNSNRVSFVRKYSDIDWRILSCDQNGKDLQTVLQLPEGCEDYAWWEDHIVVTKDSTLLIYHIDPATLQVQGEPRVLDLSIANIRNAKRLTFDAEHRQLVIAADDQE